MANRKTSSAAHTPTPWKVVGTEIWSKKHDGVCAKVLGNVGGSYSEKDRAVRQATANFIVRACNAHEPLRQSSQHLYDAIQGYIDFSDTELPEDLVEAMNEIVAAWDKADGITPDNHHGESA